MGDWWIVSNIILAIFHMRGGWKIVSTYSYLLVVSNVSGDSRQKLCNRPSILHRWWPFQHSLPPVEDTDNKYMSHRVIMRQGELNPDSRTRASEFRRQYLKSVYALRIHKQRVNEEGPTPNITLSQNYHQQNININSTFLMNLVHQCLHIYAKHEVLFLKIISLD